MPIPSGAWIELRGKEAEWAFSWIGFDLDDCFDLFRVSVRQADVDEHYDFGPCTVWALRQLTRVFEDRLPEDAAGGGFRNPDPRFYELRKRGQDYNLIVRFQESGFQKEFGLSCPEVLVDRKFLNVYEGREA